MSTHPAPPDPAHTTDLVRVARALLSVSDKSGLIDLARALQRHGVELISTGGTARAIADAGIPVTPVDQLTAFPEMLDGRVKTLHPAVHAALLARRDLSDHRDALARHAIRPIDLVCVNLYPFEATVARPGVDEAEAIEQIDIGGPSMIRSGAKNMDAVAVLTDPSQYAAFIDALDSGGGCTGIGLRRRLGVEAFRRTAAYDAAIASHLGGPINAPTAAPHTNDPTPARLTLTFDRTEQLRYGENPHQRAAFYRAPNAPAGALVNARQIHGKALSYNNLNDASAALELARAMQRVHPDRAAAVVVKHTNPCGAATAPDARAAVDLAIAGDPVAAFGGILALSAVIDRHAADRIAADGSFFEVVIAPDFDEDAAQTLRNRWKTVRLLAVGHETPDIRTEHRWIPGGLLVQERDLTTPDTGAWTLAAGPQATPEILDAASLLETVCRALSSNAVLIGGPDLGSARLFGAGAGQMDRLAACLGAVRKAGELARGAVAVSDAFFPFPDAPKILIDAGVTAIVHPGGSKRDAETFALCEQHKVTCLTTGVRHFRH